MNKIIQLDNSVFTIGFFRVLLLIVIIMLLNFGLPIPAGIVIIILLITELGRWWSRIGLNHLDISQDFYPKRIFAGEKTSLRIKLANNKLLPILIEWKQDAAIQDKSCLYPYLSIQVNFTVMVKWFSKYSWEQELCVPRRGFYRLPPASLISSDGAGFYSSMKLLKDDSWLVVYPHIVPLPEFGIKASDLIGEKTDPRNLLPDPIRVVGLREYTPDMPARLINWKASAAKDQLMAIMIEPSADYKICLAVDVLELFKITKDDEIFENALSITASVASWAEETNIPFGILANAAQVNLPGPVYVPISNGFEQLNIVLEKLARLQYQPLGSLNDILAHQETDLPWGTTLVIVGPTSLTGLSWGLRQKIEIPC